MTSLVIAACAIYLCACAALYAFQERLIYAPMRGAQADPSQEGLSFEEHWITTADGVRIHAWWLPAENRDAPAALFLHGNGGNISQWLETAATLRSLGLAVLMPDYRGYGLSEGSPTELGTYADARAAWELLTGELGAEPSRVVIIGRSLGGGVASWLAQQVDCGAVVLEATFTSVPDVGAKEYPIFPVDLLARVRYDTRARMTSLRCPALLVHGEDDTFIPITHAEALREASTPRVPLLRLRGGHNDAFTLSRERYLAGLRDFLGETLGLNQNQ